MSTYTPLNALSKRIAHELTVTTPPFFIKIFLICTNPIYAVEQVRGTERHRRTRGTCTPLFGLRGTIPLTFQAENVENLLSPAANRGDLRRSNYKKNVLGRGSAPDPTGRAHDALPDSTAG